MIFSVLKAIFKNIAAKIILYLVVIYFLLFAAYYRLKDNPTYPVANKIGVTLFKPLFWIFRDGKTAVAGDQAGPVSVSAYKIVIKNIAPSVSSSGMIDFKDKVDVYSKLSGRIEKIFVKEGDKVSVDQKLFKIESLQYELELMKQEATMESSRSQVKLAAEKYEKAKFGVDARIREMEKSKTLIRRAKDEYEKAKKTFEGKEEIYKVGGISREEFEVARLEVGNKESAFAIAKKDLEIHSLGLSDEDIIRNGYSVPASEKDRISIIKDINTKIEKAELEVAEGVLRSHQAQVNATKILLKEVMNYSPMSGIVAKKYKSQGEVISGNSGGNQAVLTIIDISQVYAVFNISESESIHLKKDMKVDFTADVFKKENFTGKIVLISPLVDQKSHTTEVKSLIKNTDNRLKPGMFIRANVLTGEPVPTILIPAAATIPKEEDRAVVLQVRDGSCYKTEIKTGKKYDDYIQVVEGLQPNDIIVLDKLSQLRDGIPVKPILGQD
ncbi:HlyD family secretion protein [Leptospira broomii serovar Hurstbridge str. 5399]|uniref:HlyD family secretion protein n=1 Tax=Leptospira broomii serovar Hurstbridge str. 5399 TaxID=1049789 RepID=T0EY15_9LEPT|nr:efflux RND transporter periplasmic adaptor subunit [Leptospira broomii]EQA43720.1 HlyD family secretion protein [Leptospira broomii serovar Hurstbridge str. 5399]